MHAIIKTIKTQYAFARPDLTPRLTSALTSLLANLARYAIIIIVPDSPYRKPANQPEQRAKRTDKSAIKSRNKNIQKYRRQKYRTDKPSALIRTVIHRNNIPDIINHW